jgi:serine/threonine protein kinase
VEKGPKLGSGGFGTVFRGSAYIYNTKKEIALKMSQHLNNHMFQREIEMLEKLKSHPHEFIVQFLGTVEIDKIQ